MISSWLMVLSSYRWELVEHAFAVDDGAHRGRPAERDWVMLAGTAEQKKSLSYCGS